MRWSDFINQIRKLGYKGVDDDLAAVKAWLDAEGHDTDKVTTKSGEFEIEKLFGERGGTPLDVTEAAEASATELEIKRRVAEIVGDREHTFTKATERTHDITVGKDRLEDDPKGGFKHFGDFLVDVKNHAINGERGAERLVKYHTLQTKTAATIYGSEGVGVDGGFAVPTAFRDSINSAVMDGGDSLMARVDEIPLSTNGIQMPVDEVPVWNNASGIKAYWEGEGSAIDQSKPNLKLKELRLRKLTALVPVTEELLDDSTALSAWVGQKAPAKIRWKVDDAIVNGTGAGQPLGILNATSTKSVAKNPAGQLATTFTAQNVVDMWSSMYGPYRMNAVWIINQDVEPQLLTMSYPGKTQAGSLVSTWGVPVYMPANGLSDSPFGSLMGRPVIPHQACPTLGTVGDVILASLPEYMMATRASGIDSSSSMHLWFDQDITAFKFRFRADGQPKLNTTIAAKNGSATYSGFVTVATR